MPRGVQSRSQRALLLSACAAAVALLLSGGTAHAEPAAVEEYRLTLPGVDTSPVRAPSPLEESSEGVGKVGVVGEQSDDFSRTAALGAAATSPAGFALLAIVIGGVGLAFLRRRGPG